MLCGAGVAAASQSDRQIDILKGATLTDDGRFLAVGISSIGLSPLLSP